MRETKRFLVDSLSHYPDLKLEWVSIDEEAVAEQVLRPSQTRGETKPKSKGKEKATMPPSGLSSDAFPVLPVDSWDGIGESDDEEEEEELVTLSGSVAFADVWEVKIFKKEITSGRL